MLKAKVSDMVAKAVEEVVVAKMLCAEKLLRLISQALVMIKFFWRRIKSRCAVSGDVHLLGRVLREVHHFQKFSGDDRRIDQRSQGSSLKADGRPGFSSNGQRSSILPSIGQAKCGLVGQFIGGM